MKKYKFTIRGNNYDVELQSIEDGVAEVEVNGSTYLVEIHEEKKQSKTPKIVRPKTEPAVASTDKARTAKPSAKATAGAVKAPLPGTILELKVKAGDEVKVGDTLLIMEAMKMENNIKADKAGKVNSIKVANGDSVMEGDVLIEIGE
jgi:biotin carboxyl carrier protein